MSLKWLDAHIILVTSCHAADKIAHMHKFLCYDFPIEITTEHYMTLLLVFNLQLGCCSLKPETLSQNS